MAGPAVAPEARKPYRASHSLHRKVRPASHQNNLFGTEILSPALSMGGAFVPPRV